MYFKGLIDPRQGEYSHPFPVARTQKLNRSYTYSLSLLGVLHHHGIITPRIKAWPLYLRAAQHCAAQA